MQDVWRSPDQCQTQSAANHVAMLLTPAFASAATFVACVCMQVPVWEQLQRMLDEFYASGWDVYLYWTRRAGQMLAANVPGWPLPSLPGWPQL